MTLIQEKVHQAIEILKEQQTDMWLTFVRETSGVRDPALDFLIGSNDLTWPSALIFTRKGERIAIIGNLEKDALQRLNVFDEIIGYDTAVSEPLSAAGKRAATACAPTPGAGPVLLDASACGRRGRVRPCLIAAIGQADSARVCHGSHNSGSRPRDLQTIGMRGTNLRRG